MKDSQSVSLENAGNRRNACILHFGRGIVLDVTKSKANDP